MRNLFATNLTDEDNPISPADAFLRDKVPEHHAECMENSGEETKKAVEKAVKGPLVLRILLVVFAAIGLGGLKAFLEILEEVDALGIFEWSLLTISVVCVAVSILLAALQHRRTKKTLESDEVTQLKNDLDRLSDSSKQLLGVPADAAELDVLGYGYEIKRGKEKQLLGAYITSSMSVFVENGELMLANDFEKYAIPLSVIRGVRVTRKKTKVFCWTKDDKQMSATYKPYMVGYNDGDGIFTVRAIYSLDIAYNGEEYELVVPNYDWELVLQPLLSAHIALQPVET